VPADAERGELVTCSDAEPEDDRVAGVGRQTGVAGSPYGVELSAPPKFADGFGGVVLSPSRVVNGAVE